MNISEKMTKAINDQIQAEFQSAYLYLSMGAWFEENNLPGFSHWMKKQYHEEVEHAMKMFDFVAERGGKVELQAISAPQKDWAGAVAVFKDTLSHERGITASIYSLLEAATKEKDYASVEFLGWFVKEQVEEEATASGILANLEVIGENPICLISLDREMGNR